MNRAFFITGTDTDVGKTLVAGALLHAAAKKGCSTLGLKPVAAGCQLLNGELMNADACSLQAASSIKYDYAQVNPAAFEPAIAPHVAAAQAGVTLRATDLAGHCRTVLDDAAAGFAVVEGAGGWLVPLNDTQTMADLAVELALPVILVVRMRLGCLNHALLTAQSICAAGLSLAGWVASAPGAAMPALDANLNTLQARLPAACLGVIPDLGDAADCRDAAGYLEIGPLLGSAA